MNPEKKAKKAAWMKNYQRDNKEYIQTRRLIRRMGEDEYNRVLREYSFMFENGGE
jgi:hypothetical protein